jgi:hypothetical protein
MVRYTILLEGQKLVVPSHVKTLLDFNNSLVLKPFLLLYKITQKIYLDKYLKVALLPTEYYQQIMDLDRSA